MSELSKSQQTFPHTINIKPPPRNSQVNKHQSKILIVSKPSNPSNQSIIEQDQFSNTQIKPIKNYLQDSPVDDKIQLLKINFQSALWTNKQRKPSQVNISVPQIADDSEDRNMVRSKGTPTQHQNLDESMSYSSEQHMQKGNWNIQKIKIVPNSNNYIESDYTLPLINEKNKEKTQKRIRKASHEVDRQRERRQRQRNMQMVNNFLSGKSSVIWLFILGDKVTEQQMAEVKKLYNQYLQKQYQIPICRSYLQAQKFLRLQNCFFKVVVDLESSSELLEQSILNKNIVSIYLYNPKQIEGIHKAFETKRQTRKIKGIFTSLKDAAKNASEQIDNETKFIKVGDQLESQKNKLRFPGFITLTGADTTEVTNYRLCLYGALKLSNPRERQIYLNQFTDMVELRYKNSEKEMANLIEYKKIDHIALNTEQKSKQILQFYVKQTFYYPLVNSILRMSRSPEEFRPCTIPFNQTYQAIKHYYRRYRNQTKGSQKKMVVYRGAKFRDSDIKSLQVGKYLQLLGFTSTSLQRSEAQRFMDSDSFLLQIHFQTTAQTQQELVYDHGFVDINRYQIATNAFQKQEQVLINALNIFQVTKIDLTSAIRTITLKYGAILPLLKAKLTTLKPFDLAIVQNYRYCTQISQNIEDDGDVLLLANQHDRCVAYYQQKINNGQSDFKIHGKLANAQLESGDLDSAYTNALKSLEKLENSSKDNEQIRKTVIQLQKNGRVFDNSEDYLHYEKCIDTCLKMFKQNWFETAKLLKQKAQQKLKAGDITGCESNLKQCRLIIDQQRESFAKRRNTINKRYYIRSLCCICSRSATNQLEEQHQIQLLKIEEDQLEFDREQQNIHSFLIQVENISKKLAEQIGNMKLYEQSQKKAQQHFNKLLKKENINPIKQAKFKTIQASIIDKYNYTTQYENTMEKAIQIVKKHDPLHKDIGTYSNILGTQRQILIKWKNQLASLNKNISITQGVSKNDEYQILQDNETKKIQQTDKFNHEQHENLRVKCQSSFQEAAQNIAYHSGKENPDYLSVRNKMVQVDLDFSCLKQSENRATQLRSYKLIRFHTEGSKCYLLLTKISLAKGQLKSAFYNVQQAMSILRTSLLKVDNKQYNAIFVQHPLYSQINLQRAKIFNRQLKHDLALKELQIIKRITQLQGGKHQQSTIFASILQEQAQIQLCMGDSEYFEEMLLKAIQIRETQMGQYNIPNAITYSNLFKFLFNLEDHESALEYHLKATQIFLRFPPDHPNSWVIHLSNALQFFRKNEYKRTIQQLQYCIIVVTHRYSKNHIIWLKINFQYGKMLRKMQYFEKSLQILNNLQKIIKKHLQEKEASGQKIVNELDDEKFILQLQIYKELKQLYQDQQNETSNAKYNSLLQVQRCNINILEMQQSLAVSKIAKQPKKPSKKKQKQVI